MVTGFPISTNTNIVNSNLKLKTAKEEPPRWSSGAKILISSFIYLFIHSFIWIAESDVASLIVICFSFSCYHDCGNHGVCSADFTCDCNLGWLGENCSVDCGCNGHSDCSQGIGICDNCQGKISWDKFRINGYGHSGRDCDVWSAYSYSILFFCDCQSGSLKSAVFFDFVFFQPSAFLRLTCFICVYYSGHLLLYNFFSTVPVDVLLAKSYVECLFSLWKKQKGSW